MWKQERMKTAYAVSLHLVANGWRRGHGYKQPCPEAQQSAVCQSASGDMISLGKTETVILTTDSCNVKHRRGWGGKSGSRANACAEDKLDL